MLNSIKDKTTATMATHFLNQKLGQAGSVKSLSLDSSLKKLSLELQLAGEDSPVLISLDKYTIHKGSEGATIQLDSFRCSKPWVELLIEKHLKNRAYQIPSMVASVL